MPKSRKRATVVARQKRINQQVVTYTEVHVPERVYPTFTAKAHTFLRKHSKSIGHSIKYYADNTDAQKGVADKTDWISSSIFGKGGFVDRSREFITSRVRQKK